MKFILLALMAFSFQLLAAETKVTPQTVMLENNRWDKEKVGRTYLVNDEIRLMMTFSGFYNLFDGKFTSFEEKLLSGGFIKSNQHIEEEKSAFSVDGKKLAILLSIMPKVSGSGTIPCGSTQCYPGAWLGLAIYNTSDLSISNFIDLTSRRKNNKIIFPELATIINESNATIVSSGTVFSTDGNSLLFAVRGSDSQKIYLIKYDLKVKSWAKVETLNKIGYKSMFTTKNKVLLLSDVDGEMIVLDRSNFKKISTINVGSTEILSRGIYADLEYTQPIDVLEDGYFDPFLKVIDLENGDLIIENAGDRGESRVITYLDAKNNLVNIRTKGDLSETGDPGTTEEVFKYSFRKIEKGSVFYTNGFGDSDLCKAQGWDKIPKLGDKSGIKFNLVTKTFEELKCTALAPQKFEYQTYYSPSRNFVYDNEMIWNVKTGKMNTSTVDFMSNSFFLTRFETESALIFIDQDSIHTFTKSEL